MKKLLLITALLAFFGSMAYGQFTTGPRSRSAFKTASPFMFTHATTLRFTNLPTAVANPFTLEAGKQLKMYWNMAGSNATYYSNVWVKLEVSNDGTDWQGDINNTNDFLAAPGPTNSVLQFMVNLNGTTASRGFTNIYTPNILDGIRYIRVGCITNVATVTTQSFWITNLNFCQ